MYCRVQKQQQSYFKIIYTEEKQHTLKSLRGFSSAVVRTSFDIFKFTCSVIEREMDPL